MAVGNDKLIHLYSREGKSGLEGRLRGREIRTIESHTDLRLRTVQAVEVPKEKKLSSLVVTGSSDGHIQVWDVFEEEDQLLCEVKTSGRGVCCASLMMNC